MVRDKKIRDQVLSGLKTTGPEASAASSNNSSDTITIDSSGVIVIDSVDNPEQVSNTTKIKDNADVNLVDIPMPNAGDKVGEHTADASATATLAAAVSANAINTEGCNKLNNNSKTDGIDNVDSSAKPRNDSKQSPMLADEAKTVRLSNTVPSEPSTAATSNNISTVDKAKLSKVSPQTAQSQPVIKATYTINKPKSLTKLPMPPGVNVNELEDITTPSPPRSVSPIGKPTVSSAKAIPAESTPAPARKGVLNLPMPPVIPGSEDLSGDDDYISSPNVNRKPLSTNPSNKKDVKRKRPVILNRRNSRSQAIKDWGERCVDVFEVIAQIGEGTYGQVRRSPFNNND